MTRTTKGRKATINLESRTAREALPLNPANPYYQKVAGLSAHIGYRPGSKANTWYARRWDRTARDGKGAQQTLAIGELHDQPDHPAFAQAVERAREWVRELEGGYQHGATVADACRAYIRNIRLTKGEKNAHDAERVFRNKVYGQPFGRIELARLTPMHVQDWRDAMVPADQAKDAEHLRRMKSTANRHHSRLVAALNYGRVIMRMTANAPWAGVKKFPDADGKRTLMLEPAQCAALIEASGHDLAALVRALLLTGMRPGEAPKLTVGQFDAARGVVHVIESKTKSRTVVLSDEAIALFKAQCRNKLPAALVFTRADGSPWRNSNHWNPPAKAAAKVAGLPGTFSLYCLRHTYISRAIHAGVDLLTVSRLVGTSVQMIQKNYGHLAGANDVRQRLNGIRLSA